MSSLYAFILSLREIISNPTDRTTFSLLVESLTVRVRNLANTSWTHIRFVDTWQAFSSFKSIAKGIIELLGVSSFILALSVVDASSFESKSVLVETSETLTSSVAGLAEVVGELADVWKVKVVAVIAALTNVGVVVEMFAFSCNWKTSAVGKEELKGASQASWTYLAKTKRNIVIVNSSKIWSLWNSLRSFLAWRLLLFNLRLRPNLRLRLNYRLSWGFNFSFDKLLANNNNIVVKYVIGHNDGDRFIPGTSIDDLKVRHIYVKSKQRHLRSHLRNSTYNQSMQKTQIRQFLSLSTRN